MPYSFRGEKFFLSNHYPIEITYQNELYLSSEHCFIAQKCENKYEKEMIKRAATPGEAKKLGRKVMLIDNWDEKKLQIMKDILRAKFAIPEMRNKLLATNDEPLIEENEHGDRFWGTVNGIGQNHLGIILMEIRKEIANE